MTQIERIRQINHSILHAFSPSIPNYFHLINQMAGTGILIDEKKHKADIETDVAADVGIELQVAHCAFPNAVEIQADKIAVGIESRTARIAAGGVASTKETNSYR